ncbi:MAG: hypothetical protein ABJG14_21985 [Sulfitobacter sp.]|uniref:hypothetical protein n=1 Tax=Alphaproteobacteria TaxID=28211 RepID=UPI001ADADA92|nr:hypothetical protein [Sulfitobacter sp. R18_1]MBO9430586.1 hypothetical protein [Sulfitobacter sp. R18_1]
MILAHITPEGLKRGLTPARLNRLIEDIERDAFDVFDLDPIDFTIIKDGNSGGCPPAQQVAS